MATISSGMAKTIIILDQVYYGDIDVEAATVLLGWTKEEVELGMRIRKVQRLKEKYYEILALRKELQEELKNPYDE